MLHILHKISEKLSFKPSKKVLTLIISAIFLASGLFYYFFASSPTDFPLNTMYSIEERQTLTFIADGVKKKDIVKSALVLKVLTILFSKRGGVISGDYILNKKENVFEIAERFATGDYRLSSIRVTFPEGLNVYEMAGILSKKEELRNFNKEDFIRLAKDKEGYLYPDTYFFLPNVKSAQIIETMEKNFSKKISIIQKDTRRLGKTLEEILTMASILEKEVPETEDRKIVAGILWKRIKNGIPLQVDAVFPYITQRKDRTITREDLKIDSPYNTYLHKGLPPGPISNPSLDAIVSAMNPVETKYFFYISDKKGITHFAKTLKEHNDNIDIYLR